MNRRSYSEPYCPPWNPVLWAKQHMLASAIALQGAAKIRARTPKAVQVEPAKDRSVTSIAQAMVGMMGLGAADKLTLEAIADNTKAAIWWSRAWDPAPDPYHGEDGPWTMWPYEPSEWVYPREAWNR